MRVASYASLERARLTDEAVSILLRIIICRRKPGAPLPSTNSKRRVAEHFDGAPRDMTSRPPPHRVPQAGRPCILRGIDKNRFNGTSATHSAGRVPKATRAPRAKHSWVNRKNEERGKSAPEDFIPRQPVEPLSLHKWTFSFLQGIRFLTSQAVLRLSRGNPSLPFQCDG